MSGGLIFFRLDLTLPDNVKAPSRVARPDLNRGDHGERMPVIGRGDARRKKTVYVNERLYWANKRLRLLLTVILTQGAKIDEAMIRQKILHNYRFNGDMTGAAIAGLTD